MSENQHGGPRRPPAADRLPLAQGAPSEPMPAKLASLDDDRILDVDVRDDLRSGREPFSRIMAGLRSLPPGHVLRVRAIFEPVPLYGVMAKNGLDHWTERLADDDWRIWFYREADVEEATPSSLTESREANPEPEPAPEAEPDVVVLDVRGLEPPEPMVRTLEALEALPPGKTLVQINARVPQFLLPQLEARGFTYEVRPQSDDLVRVFIRRASE